MYFIITKRNTQAVFEGRHQRWGSHSGGGDRVSRADIWNAGARPAQRAEVQKKDEEEIMKEETGAGPCRARSPIICKRYHNTSVTSISIFLKPVVSYNRPEGQDKIKLKEGYRNEENDETAGRVLCCLPWRQRLRRGWPDSKAQITISRGCITGVGEAAPAVIVVGSFLKTDVLKQRLQIPCCSYTMVQKSPQKHLCAQTVRCRKVEAYVRSWES